MQYSSLKLVSPRKAFASIDVMRFEFKNLQFTDAYSAAIIKAMCISQRGQVREPFEGLCLNQFDSIVAKVPVVRIRFDS